MNNYDILTSIRQEIIDGMGPWTLRNKFENEQTWNIVSNDWNTIFRDAILENVNDRSLVVQAGGWQGLYPALLSNMFDTVYTFEPDPVNFYCLTQNCQKDNIHKFQSTLSDKTGVVSFEEVPSTGQGRVEQPNPYNIHVERRFTVPALAIDSLNLPSCGLIMLDVESFEHTVLVGAVHTIRKYSPIVITEKNFRPDENEQTINLMKSLGYYLKQEYPIDMLFAPLPA